MNQSLTPSTKLSNDMNSSRDETNSGGHRQPPLHTLRAFEAAVRLGSFTKAAEEVCLTVSAVSHQIRNLEKFYETPLFNRNRERVTLTAAGAQLLPAVRVALESLSAITLRMRPVRTTVRISVLPSLANRWLLPRLDAFFSSYPEIDIHIFSSQEVLDLGRHQLAMAIRYGSGEWPGCESSKLASETLFPVTTAAMLRLLPADERTLFSTATLLRDEYHPWDDFLGAVGLSIRDCKTGPLFGDSAQLLDAAARGNGVALARSRLVDDALKSQELARVGSRESSARGSYYLVAPNGMRGLSSDAAVFAEWLQQAFSA